VTTIFHRERLECCIIEASGNALRLIFPAACSSLMIGQPRVSTRPQGHYVRDGSRPRRQQSYPWEWRREPKCEDVR
jgi:hypothetical protein